MSAEKPLEFLLFSGDYDAVIARTSSASDASTLPALIGALALSGRLDEAESAFRSLSGEGADSAAITQARFFVTAGLCHAGNVKKALRLVRASLADLRRADRRERFWIWQGLALVRFFEGRFHRARFAGRRALASAMEASFPYARVLALDLLAHVLVQTGGLHAGMRMLDQAADLAASLGYEDNTTTLRTSAVVFQLQYLLTDIDTAIARATEAVAAPAVSYFTRRSALVELASAWALRGQAERAQAVLDEARRIALPGSDRRAKTRWLVAQALVMALSRGGDSAREVLDEARHTAGDQMTLLAELGFVEALFVGPSNRLRETFPVIARATGIARAQLVAAWLTGGERPTPTQVEDGLCRVLLRTWAAQRSERVALLSRAGLLGLVSWALDLEPSRRLILTATELFTERHGVVTAQPAPTGPSLRLLLALRGGFQAREDLARDVWGLSRYNPSKHSAVINTAVSRLRTALGDPAWVVTHEQGYHLAEGIDLVSFDDPAACEPKSSPPPPRAEEAQVVALLDREGASTSVAVARALGMSPSSALRLLRRLVADGRLVRVGAGRATRYAVAG